MSIYAVEQILFGVRNPDMDSRLDSPPQSLTLIAVMMSHQYIGDMFHANISQMVKYVATAEIYQYSYAVGTENVDVAGIAKKIKLISDTGKHHPSTDKTNQPCS
jgi:hypothetical protein